MSDLIDEGPSTDEERAILALFDTPGFRAMPIREILRRLNASAEQKRHYRRAIRSLVQKGLVLRQGNRLGKRAAATAASRSSRSGGERAGPAARGAGRPAAPPRRHVVGILRQARGSAYIESFDPAESRDLRVPQECRGDSRPGDAVVVEVPRVVRAGQEIHARVIEILGPIDRPGTDVLVVARRHSLATEFPEVVLREADRLPSAVPPEESQSRERFDDPAPVTIDGDTARDFDDAIAVSELPREGFRLAVHIADVGHFVKPGSALDREARRRGTSVYFPDRVFPMFPEKLSNDLCSLRPREDRLVQSVILDIDREGVVRKVRFADGVIRSAARLTYTQVASVLEDARHVPGVPPELVPMLRLAERLREVLGARRRARGSVDLDLPEPRVLLDIEGVMTGITVEPRNRAHRLIEEFMLLANEAVAGHLESRKAPCLYRVHETPDPAKIETLAEFAAGFGLQLTSRPDAVAPGDIQRLLDAAEGRPEYPIVAQVALRSMKQARYTADNVGHFGLAAPVYAHFTSPIRRYPDLVVHRALRAQRKSKREELAAIADGLEELGVACSALEREAEAAERELLEWKKINFARDKVGEEFEGIVTGVARFGLFVQLTENLVEGLLHAARLGGDRFDFIEARQELRGASSRASFRLGDRLRVRLDRVDTVLRRVDLSLAEVIEHRAAPKAKGSGSGSAPPRKRPGPGRGVPKGRR